MAFTPFLYPRGFRSIFPRGIRDILIGACARISVRWLLIVKLARLLELHSETPSPRQSAPAETSLNANFGDTYLLRHNRIFRNIRLKSIESGYVYSSDLNPSYLALPFSQLEPILTTKRIPYFDNVSVLKQLLTQANVREVATWDDISDGFKPNHVFHEGCHAVARDTSLRCKLEQGRTPHEHTLQALLEESFANTCELLAVIDVEDTAHRCFYSANSYTTLFENRGQLKKAMADHGEPFLFKFLMLAYLYANFLYEELEDAALTDVITLAGFTRSSPLSSNEKKALRALSRIPFTLDLRFREVTTRFHLALLGLKQELRDLLSQDLALKMRAPKYVLFLKTVTELALSGMGDHR